jgi:hypothetical protein
MPYVITTTTADALAATAMLNGDEAMSLTLDEAKAREAAGTTRLAVATLDEARDACRAVDPDDNAEVRGPLTRMVDALTESGGTVGPLPDGTVIEVTPVTDDQLRAAVAHRIDGAYTRSITEIVAAYNGHAIGGRWLWDRGDSVTELPSSHAHEARAAQLADGSWQARCDCGWEGVVRRGSAAALNDRDRHIAAFNAKQGDAGYGEACDARR